MPTNLELLEGLRDGFENLGYQDEEKLSELSNRELLEKDSTD